MGIKYSYEIAGNDYQAMAADGFPAPFDMVTTGGAMSRLFPLPNWQKGITLIDTSGATITPTGRCTSDVSFNSGVYGGLGVIFLKCCFAWIANTYYNWRNKCWFSFLGGFNCHRKSVCRS